MTAPNREAPGAVYRRYLDAGMLGFQRCEDCGKAIFYPRILCPFCGGDALVWEASAGRGTVYAATTVHRRDGAPYNVVLVDLEEGFRMMSRVENAPPGGVGIGLSVRFEVRRGEDAEPVAVFVPEKG